MSIQNPVKNKIPSKTTMKSPLEPIQTHWTAVFAITPSTPLVSLKRIQRPSPRPLRRFEALRGLRGGFRGLGPGAGGEFHEALAGGEGGLRSSGAGRSLGYGGVHWATPMAGWFMEYSNDFQSKMEMGSPHLGKAPYKLSIYDKPKTH